MDEVKRRMTSIQKIVDEIIAESSYRNAQDEVAAIMEVKMEIDLVLQEIMAEIRRQERR